MVCVWLYVWCMCVCVCVSVCRNLLLPRGMPAERPWAQFLVRVYRAEGLPSMSAGFLGNFSKMMDRNIFIDPYVQVTFAGQQVPAHTHAVTYKHVCTHTRIPSLSPLPNTFFQNTATVCSMGCGPSIYTAFTGSTHTDTHKYTSYQLRSGPLAQLVPLSKRLGEERRASERTGEERKGEESIEEESREHWRAEESRREQSRAAIPNLWAVAH